MIKALMTRDEFRTKASELIMRGNNIAYLKLALDLRPPSVREVRGINEVKQFIESHRATSGIRDVYRFVRGLKPYNIK